MKPRLQSRLTKRTVDTLQPPSEGYALVWDNQLSGFGCRITSSGVRAFILNYRFCGRERRLTLGRYGALSVDQARSLAAEKLRDVARGVDPMEARIYARDRVTFAELTLWYLERHAHPRKSPDAAKEDQRKLEQILIPKWGRRHALEISRTDIVRLHNEMKETISGFTANRYLALLGKLFELAIEWGVRLDNPARGIKRFPEEKRDRWLRPDEIRRMFEAIALETDATVRAAIAFIFLTGARKNEALRARWSDIDFDNALWRIAKTKAQKPQVVPLSTRALAAIQSLPRIDGNPHIFPGRVPGKPLVNLSKAWIRIRNRAKLEEVRIHDLRRSLGSLMVQSGTSLYVVQRALRHSDSRTTSDVYAHLGEDPTRAALEQAGNTIGALMGNAEAN